MRTAWARLAKIGAVAALPATAILLLAWILFGRTIFDAGFSSLGIWNDELYYWHQIATFRDHGFGGGYYTFGEVPADWFSRFGAEGPIYPLLFGSIARVFGWHYYSAALFHLVILTASIAALVHFAQLRGLRLLVTALVYVSFWPLMFFTATPMEEGLHYAIASILAILFYRIAILKMPLTWRSRVAWLAFLAFACLLRPTWSVLLLPFFVYTSASSPRSLVGAFLKAGIGMPASFAAFAYLTAPYPYGFLELLRGGAKGFGEQVRLVGQHALANIRTVITPDGSLLVTDLQRVQHVQVVAILAFLCFVALASLRIIVQRRSGRTGGGGSTTNWPAAFPLFFHVVNLGSIAVALILMYDIGSWRDYRTMAPHLLLSVVLVVTMRNSRWLVLPILFVLSNLIFASAFVQDFQTYRASSFSGVSDDVETFSASVESEMRYRPGADPWCNTLLSSWPGGEALPLEILGVPSGIGVSLDYSGGVAAPLKSAYVLTSQENYEILKGQTELVLLTETSHGNLYFNIDSGCAPRR